MYELKACPFTRKEKMAVNNLKIDNGNGAYITKRDADVILHYIQFLQSEVEWLSIQTENTSEVVKKLWALYDKYEDAEHVVCGDAAKMLQAAPENNPLTVDELRQMDGEPVWVVFAGNADWPPKAHWCFVRATKCILQVYPCAVHQAKNWMYTGQDFSCGVANAYTRKPEGSHA